MFENIKDFKLACPRCNSENVFVGRKTVVSDNDDVRCNDCSYSQKGKRFKDQWRILNTKRKVS